MSKIGSMMQMGNRALMNSQAALQTVSHNIANKSTEGYSRQRVEVLSNISTGSGPGNLRLGTGARAGVVTRTNNPWLEKQIQRENINMGFMDAKADGMERVEQIYNEQINRGLNHYMGDFFNSFRELANTPESLASRTLVREAASAMANDFARVHSQLRDIQEDFDGQMVTTVEEINQTTKEISSLNEKIHQIEIQGTHANDERDRRDLLLKKLSEKIDITWAEGSDHQVNITAGRTGLLVSGTGSSELKAVKGDPGNRIQIFLMPTPDATPSNITSQITGGRLGGYLDIRDKVVEDCISKLDGMCFTLASEVNEAHQEGYDRLGRPGEDFFNLGDGPEGLSSRLKISESILKDVGKISVAAHPNAPGDSSIANVIQSLQYQKLMDDGRATFDDYYNTQVGQIGAVAQRSVKSKEAQGNILTQLSNIRESISGVSLDEEASKMIEFQKTYDASARMIRTADEMLDTVLNLKRL